MSFTVPELFPTHNVIYYYHLFNTMLFHITTIFDPPYTSVEKFSRRGPPFLYWLLITMLIRQYAV